VLEMLISNLRPGRIGDALTFSVLHAAEKKQIYMRRD